MAFVYWIHLPEHTDILSQGYIGITSKTVDERYRGHLKALKSKKSSHIIFYKALKKHLSRVLVTTLLEADLEYAKLIENKLRPKIKIGWNTAEGGTSAPINLFTDATRTKISEALKGRVKTQAEIENIRKALVGKTRPVHVIEAMRKAKTGVPRSELSKESQKATLKACPWRNRTAKLDVWAAGETIHRNFILGADTLKSLSTACEIPQTSLVCILKKLRAGWNPIEDINWVDFKLDYDTKIKKVRNEVT